MRAHRAGYINGDEFAGPFAITHNLLCQIRHHRQQAGAKLSQCRILNAGNVLMRSSAGRCQQHHITGGGIAINSDGIKGAFDSLCQAGLQHIMIQRCVRGDKAKHGGHIRGNHTRAFGNARYGYGRAGNLTLACRPFGKCICGANGIGGLLPAGTAQLHTQIGEASGYLCGIKRLTYHAGRGAQHLILCNIQLRRQCAEIIIHSLHACGAGKGVGIAGIHNHSLSFFL